MSIAINKNKSVIITESLDLILSVDSGPLIVSSYDNDITSCA